MPNRIRELQRKAAELAAERKALTASIDAQCLEITKEMQSIITGLKPIFVKAFNDEEFSHRSIDRPIEICVGEIKVWDKGLYVECEDPVTGHPYDRVDFEMSFEELLCLEN